MTGALALPSVPVLGAQRPRIMWAPSAATSAGREAVDLARLAGLQLDPWEEFVLERSLGERPDGKWAAWRVGLVVPRQNGKGTILEARELAGLILFNERLLIHSAHEQATSSEHFLRMLDLIDGVPEFRRRMLRPSRGKGAEAIKLRDGKRLLFKTRTGGGGRGLTGDFVGLDEAMILPTATTSALVPTMAAKSLHGNPQLWYTGSAVDQQQHEHGTVLAEVRAAGIEQNDPRLAYFEWSTEGDDPSDVPDSVLRDPHSWAQANPGLGIRISGEHIESEVAALGRRAFAVERLGIGDWPSLAEEDGEGITREMWEQCADDESVVRNPVRFAFDVTPDRTRTAIAAAGLNESEEPHVEIVEHKPGTRWVAARLAELVSDHDAGPVVLAARSPAAALIPKLVEIGVAFEVLDGPEFAQACGGFFDDVSDGSLRHLGTPELTAAALGAKQRPAGDSMVWSRKTSMVDISPLVAATLARHASLTMNGYGPAPSFEVLI